MPLIWISLLALAILIISPYKFIGANIVRPSMIVKPVYEAALLNFIKFALVNVIVPPFIVQYNILKFLLFKISMSYAFCTEILC